jgi:hypothetical protein
MKTTIEMAQSPLKTEREIGVARTISNAVMLARDPEWDKQRAYAVAEGVIVDFNLPDDEGDRAIALLKEALKI